MARHYSLPLWSYRDAVLAPASLAKQAHLPEIRFVGIYDRHPSWHVHLFMADLFAGIWTSEMRQCELHPAHAHHAERNSSLLLPTLLYATNNSVEARCNASVTPLLSWAYDRAARQSMSIVGNYTSSPAGEWLARVDVKDKGGLIRELNLSPQPSALLTTPPVSTASATTYGDKATLTFVFALDSETIVDIRTVVNFKLTYLSTYFNAGQIQISFCRTGAVTIDALWPDYEKYFYSYPQIHSTFRKAENCRRFPEVVITHANITSSSAPQHRAAAGMSEKEIKARSNQKFKIVSIEACVGHTGQPVYG